MALSIRISRTGCTNCDPGGDGNYALGAESIRITHSGSPIVAVLPGADPLLLNLGQWKVTIVIDGIANKTATDLSDGSVSIADKDDLEAMADPTITDSWFDETVTIHDETVAGSFATYTVQIASIALSKDDVRDYWHFNMQAIGKLASQA
jgi:hypothetical protein